MDAGRLSLHSWRLRFGLMLAAALGVAGGMIVWQHLADRQTHVEAAQAALLGEARRIVANESATLQRADAVLNGLALSHRLAPPASADACERWLNEQLRSEPAFERIGVVGPDGKVVCSAGAPAAPSDFSSPELASGGPDNEAEVIDGPAGPRLILRKLARGDRGDGSQLQTLYYLVQNLEWMGQALSTSGLPAGAMLILLDAQDSQLARFPAQDAAHPAAVLPTVQAQRAGPWRDHSDASGQARIAADLPLPGAGGHHLLLSLPREAVEAVPRHGALQAMGLSLLVLIGVAALLLLVLDRNLMRPLGALSRTAQQLRAGQRDARSGLRHGQDEIGQLARALDEGAAVIQHRERVLALANRSLALLSAGNRVLTLGLDEQALPQQMCQALGEVGDLRLAWFAAAGQDGEPRPPACWGLDPAMLAEMGVPSPEAWQALAQREGCATSLLLPATQNGQSLGMLGVLSARPEAIDPGLVEALQESVQNLAQGIDRARSEQDRRRAAAALQASNAKLEAALDNLHDPLLIADQHGRYIHFNEACVAFHRAKDKDECARAFGDCEAHFAVLREDGSALAYEQWPLSRALRGERGRNVEFTVQRLDNAERWIGSYSFAPIRGPDGEIAGAVVSARDLSEQRSREAELMTAHERLRLALNAGGAGYWDWVIDTDHLTWSPEIFQLLGLNPQTTVAGVQAWEAAVHPQDREHVRQQLRQVMHERRPLELEYRVSLHDGRVRWIQATGSATQDDNGRLLSMTGICTDVTQRKQSELELRNYRDHLEELVTTRTAALLKAKEGAEAAGLAKSAFLANMSHEIRTPMNAIVGLTHLCMRDNRDAQLSDRLLKIDVAARHLLQILNDVLDLSKIGAGKLTLERIEFPRDELLGRVMSMVGEEARRKGLELILDTDHLPRMLCGDPKHLAQALINLMSNAVKFTEYGWIRLGCKKLTEEATRQQLRFEVQDTGIGIPVHQQGALFGAFEQADTSTTRRYGGSGLGLALTQQLVTLMQGEVGFSSEAGAGSHFWFTVWLDKARPAASLPPQALQGLRVLLVDDLAPSLEAISDSLQLLQISVDAQASGPAALHRVQEEAQAGRNFDVLLLDATMSPLDGIETLGAMRRLLAGRLPPAILVSRDDAGPLWQKAREAGFDAVLLKPVTPSALQDALTRVLQRERAVEPATAAPDRQSEFQRLRRHAGQRVLLAEDNPVNQEVAGDLLTAAGLVVELAPHGQAALKMAGERHYDLVLMDIQMPGMDGLSATRALRASGLAKLPIVAMTANVSPEDRAACLAAGMNDHFGKPVDPSTLYRLLLRWLPPPAMPAVTPATAAAGPALPQRLAAVDGFDLERALRNLGGQVATVERVLRSFVRSYSQQAAPEILAAAASDPVLHWREQSHSIRGACATIGATVLEGELRGFERELAKPDDLPALALTARQLQSQLHGLAARLDAALQ